MTTIVHYGAGATLELPLAEGVLVAQCGAPPSSEPHDLPNAVAKSFGEPLDFPDIAQTLVPGDDMVAIALGHAVPRAAELIAAIVQYLVKHGVEPAHIAVVREKRDAEAGVGDPTSYLPSEVAEQLTLVTHCPDDRNELAYLGDFSDGRPMLLNRMLADADVVLPIGCFRPSAEDYYQGVHATLVPQFLDREGREQILTMRSVEGAKIAAEVAGKLGSLWTVQIIPGMAGEVGQLLAGENEAVEAECEQAYRRNWGQTIPRRVSLVVATIEGDKADQTWEQLAKTLRVAIDLVEDDGAIAVCCDLADQPGRAVRCLLEADTRESALAWIEETQPEDRNVATQLVHVSDRARVYLLSRLAPSLVEDLEMMPLEHGRELARLASRHASCVILNNAAYASIRVEEE